MKRKILALALVGLLQGCGGNQAEAPKSREDQMDEWKAEILHADEAFAEAMTRDGLSQWGSFFAPDGAVIQQGAGELRGREAIQSSMDAATSVGGLASLTWAPDRAEVSNGGDLGYTVGSYRSIGIGADGVEMVSTGMYVSIWRRQEDGSWKVEMDLGNPLTPPEPLSSLEPNPTAQDHRP